MNKVLIIGNGFDLDLGLKTSYNNFIESSFFQNISKTGMLISKILEYKSIHNWVDLELEIRKYISVSENHSKDGVKRTIKSYTNLNNALQEYLKSLNYSNINNKSIAAKLLQAVGINGYFSIYNYNYTDFSRISQFLGFQNLKYTPVHGEIRNSSIIFGVDDDVKSLHKDYCFMIKSHNPYYRSCNIRYALEKADEVVFFGHSLGITDYHYFSNFFLNQSGNNGTPQKKKTIRIFTYDEDSRLDILLQLREMNNKKTNELFDLNDFRIYCTNKKEDVDDINRYCQNLINNSLENQTERLRNVFY